MKTKCIYLLLSMGVLIATKGMAQVDGETYYIQSAIAKKQLDVQWASSENGTPLHLWPYNGDVAQKFTLEDAGGGYFFMKSTLGKYLHVEHRSSAPGKRPLLWEGKGNDNTKWKFVPSSDGYVHIMSKKGTFMEVKNPTGENGNLTHMWRFKNDPAQKWKLIPVNATKIEGDKWQLAFVTALADIEVNIDNYTPTDFEFSTENVSRYYRPDNSYIALDSEFGSFRYDFPMNYMRIDPLTVYIDDLSLSNIRVSSRYGKVLLYFNFEDNGPEIRTNCIDDGDCAAIGNPNFDILNPKIVLSFVPTLEGGFITYDELDVQFTGKLQHIGFNFTVDLGLELAKAFNFDVDNALARRAEAEIRQRFNQPELKQQINRILNNSLASATRFDIEFPTPLSGIVLDTAGNLHVW